jgi:hypothetical protein
MKRGLSKIPVKKTQKVHDNLSYLYLLLVFMRTVIHIFDMIVNNFDDSFNFRISSGLLWWKKLLFDK